MASEYDLSGTLAETVRAAAAAGQALAICGGGSKSWYGRTIQGEPLTVAGHHGIVDYQPSELVITARAGTTLAELEATLAERGQMLGFEPPWFGDAATLGGTLACALSGPRRPYAGAARDFVLGMKVLNGKGEVLRFGGQVMKNVAGYDVARLFTGSLGTLGVILEASLKVVPRPAEELTVARECRAAEAIDLCNQWAGQPLPISAAAHVDGVLHIRLSGAGSAVAAARRSVGGETLEAGAAEAFWRDLRELRLPFFSTDAALPLWRLSLPPAAAVDLPGRWLIDWGGAQRWLRSSVPADTIFRAAEQAGGHATLFRGGDRSGHVFQPLPPALAALHRRL
ncbi:MAG TPA: glycolate oxidase subunit GlcE, partial [Candidatus Competibacteraceae bacterium]|nr:glycolate oxidase subunit GlcE [Candidatus Competibacteraceae bacterium]